MRINFLRHFLITPLLSGLLIHKGCSAVQDKEMTCNAAQPNQTLNVASLALTGYNYTDKSIDGFTVDGLGGGNLRVSGESNGGGGDVCCLSYLVGAKARTVKVRWQKSACWEKEDPEKTSSDIDQNISMKKLSFKSKNIFRPIHRISRYIFILMAM
jgi:hypothetical protein